MSEDEWKRAYYRQAHMFYLEVKRIEKALYDLIRHSQEKTEEMRALWSEAYIFASDLHAEIS